MQYSPDSLLADILENRDARALLQRYVPGVVNSPLIVQLRRRTLGEILTGGGPHGRLDPQARETLWAELGEIDAGAPSVHIEAPEIEPAHDYESSDVALASARVESVSSSTMWAGFELVLAGPSHGNPFVDVDLTATFTAPDGTESFAGGFYDGDGRWLVRFLPNAVGDWSLITASTARSLHGIEVSFAVGQSLLADHGPLRVADTFHFAHADGTRNVPLGTTSYAWTHQPESLQEKTLETLAVSPFTKMRMGVFPKAYLFNTNDPERFAFVRNESGDFDFTRFDPAFFRHLEGRIADLGRIGIEADIIIFHAYDRWGFSDMGRAADDRYVQYLVRRLSFLPNVWWSLANEYDLVSTKSVDDWERFAGIIGRNDPAGHLTSIHNCFGFYDYSKSWITHSSIQRIDVYRTAENTDAWRSEWNKPVVIDEAAYEGDIDQGWGNITGEEMVRRFWEGAVRGGYVGHGETYLNDREELWWSKGGELVGSSPARIAFLREITAASPTGVLDPLPSDWDTPFGGVEDEYVILYFGFNRPSYRDLTLKAGIEWRVDVIDTWNMTIETLPETHSGSFRVTLPARQYMAIRLVAISANG